MLKLWKRLPKGTKTKLANSWYELLSRVDTGDDITFMNHGWAPVSGDPETIDLPDHLEKHRYEIQHYHNLAAMVPWEGKEAIEVSSGRGGGAAYVFDTFKPRSMIGVDLAPASVEFSNATYADRDGLSFEIGDAQDLPLGDACCDIVINVESSFNYPEQNRFFAEVARVLRPGGHFLFADYRGVKGAGHLRSRLDALAFETIHTEDLSANISRALELSDTEKSEKLKRQIPTPLRGLVATFVFSGAAARAEIEKFRSGEKVYILAVLRKPGGDA